VCVRARVRAYLGEDVDHDLLLRHFLQIAGSG
jgi:hypothetical protein